MISDLRYVPCSHRKPRTDQVDLIVIHTNEGPEGPNSAEGLAAYLAQAHVEPGYHFVVDENSAIRCAGLNERVNGAGGVNDRAIHICITGYAGQSSAQWNDQASTLAINRATAIAIEVSRALNIPWTKIGDPRPDNRGLCGHVDVSRYYSASQAHSDPGINFPWGRFLASNLEDMSAADVAAINAHTDNAVLVGVGAIFAEINPRLEALEAQAKTTAADAKSVKQAVRDGDAKSIPAKTLRAVEALGNTPGE